MKRNIENINPLSKETDKRLKSYGIDSDSDESHEIIKQHSSEQNKVLSTSTASDNQNTLTDQTNFVLPQSTTIEEQDIIDPQVRLGELLHNSLEELQTFVKQHRDSLDLNKSNLWGNPPIVVAAKRPNAILPTVQFLLEQGANPNGVDKKGNTFLHHLLINKHAVSKITPPFLELAIKKGFNLYLENKEGHTAFDIAKNKNLNQDLKAILNLLEVSEIIEEPLIEEESIEEEPDIINPQIKLGKFLPRAPIKEVQTFVEQHKDSLDLNKPNQDDNPPIVVAAKRISAILPTVQFLLEQGVNPNGVDKKGNTFLHHLLNNNRAFSKITPSFLELAIKKGFNLYLENKEGYTAFDIAKNQNLKQEILKLLKVSEIMEEPLIEEEPDIINPQIKLGGLLHNSIEELQAFVEQHRNSLDLNKPNLWGNPPIVVAAKRISAILPTVQFLLEQGANPNGVDKKGNTFLHHLLINKHAVSKITPSFLELAIKKGFNLYLENKEGYTAFDIAKSKDMNNSLLELLQGESIENDINQESVTYDNPTSQQDDQKVTNTNKGALSFICQQQDDYTIPSIGDDGFSDYVV